MSNKVKSPKELIKNFENVQKEKLGYVKYKVVFNAGHFDIQAYTKLGRYLKNKRFDITREKLELTIEELINSFA